MTTPNMNLTLPVVSQTPGPTWASEINSDLTIIDGHNHAGVGALVPVAGLDINSDLSLATHALTDVTKVALLNQGSNSTVNSVYAASGNLWWKNGSGTAVQITSGGSVNVGGAGSIGGIIGSAAVNYVSPTLSFDFTDENGNAAALIGSLVKISSVSLLPGVGSLTYTLRMPPSYPSATSFVTSTVSGTVASLAFNDQAGYITRTMQAAVGQQRSTITSPSPVTSTFPTFVNVSSAITVTCSGRPIVVGVMSSEGSSPSYSYIRLSGSGVGFVGAYFQVDVTGTASTKIMSQHIKMYCANALDSMESANCLQHVYIPPSAGSYTFQLQACVDPSGSGYTTSTLNLSYPILYAYEL